MAVNLSPVGGVAAQFFTSTGAVLTGGKLYTYAAGTTTPAVTYTTSQGNIPWTNPVVLDAAGRVPGSGEIWLTDGIIYKFVLKDSNDVLIATYDNITGINSNSVSYTNQQEIITATAGQTVFNLGISYQPATNSLSVFVDGVNQYGPGAQYSYVETDSNTVTFNSGLHVGAEVKFTTTQQQGAGAVDASQVSYDPPFTGSVATNVEAKLAQAVTLDDFGAVNGADVKAAFQAAVNALYALGGGEIVDTSESRSYLLSDTVTLKQGVKVNLPNSNFTWDGIDPLAGIMFEADFTGTPSALDFRIQSYTASQDATSTLIALKLVKVSGGNITFGGGGGGYGIHSSASYNYRVRNLDVGNTAIAGYYHQGDLGAEIYLSDCYISYGNPNVGTYGVLIERTTTGDVGGYYFDNVLVVKGASTTMQQGIYFKATTYPTTLAVQMRGGGSDGSYDDTAGKFNMRIENIATAFFTGSWFDKVGFYTAEGMIFTSCNVASGFYFKGSTNTANLQVSNIRCGEQLPFNFDAGATVTDLLFNNIRSSSADLLSNDEAKMTAGQSPHQSRIVTSSTDVEGAICWQNADDNTKKIYWRVNASGNLILLDETFSTEIVEINQNGAVSILKAGQGLVLKSPNGLVTKTLTIDNAGAIALL